MTTASTATEIFAAYETAKPSQALYDQNLKAIKTQLTTRHGFALSAGDLEGIDFVYGSWFEGGPDLRYQLNGGGGPEAAGVGGGRGGGGGLPTYADLMTANDGTGRMRSYLATEENFKFMKDLETRNMLVPVVGNFGGPKALRAVASYLKQKGPRGVDVLFVQRGAVPPPGRHLGQVLRERGHDAARREEHADSVGARRLRGIDSRRRRVRVDGAAAQAGVDGLRGEVAKGITTCRQCRQCRKTRLACRARLRRAR